MRRSVVRSLTLSIALLAGSALPQVAEAQEERCSPYGVDVLHERINEINQLIAEFDLDYGRHKHEEYRRFLRCLETPIDPEDLGRFAQQRVILSLLGQDTEGARRWLLLFESSAPHLPWPSPFDQGHPLLDNLLQTPVPPVVTLEGQNLEPPRRGAILVNGYLADTPEAITDMSHFVQVFDRRGELVESYWQEGAMFRDHLVTEGGSPPVPPRWYTPHGERPVVERSAAVADGAGPSFDDDPFADFDIGPPPGGAVVIDEDDDPLPPVADADPDPDPVADPDPQPDPVADVEPVADPDPEPVADPDPEPVADPDPEPDPVADADPDPTQDDDAVADADATAGPAPVVPERPTPTGGPLANANMTRLQMGAGLGVVAGALYGLAAVQAGAMNRTGDPEQLVGIRSRTNLMVVGAGVTGAAALGLGVTAFVSDEGTGLRVNLRW